MNYGQQRTYARDGLLLEDSKRLQELEPNAGTEARIWLAKGALESGDHEDNDR